MTGDKLAQRYVSKMYRKRMRALAVQIPNVLEEDEEEKKGKDKEAQEEIDERNYYKTWRGGF